MLNHFLKVLFFLLSLFLPASLYSQAGYTNIRGLIVQEPGNALKRTTITDNAIQSAHILLLEQDDEGPTLQFHAPTDDDDLFEVTDGTTPMIEMGWVAGGSNFGKLRIGSDLDAEDATTIEGAGLTARTIVLRNLAGFDAAIHLEERDGGTDTVQLKGPLSTSGVSFYWPGTDGTAGQCLSTNGSGVLSWSGCSGGTGSSAGATGDVQFSADGAGTFGADSAMNWNNTDKRLKIGSSPTTTERLNVDGNIAIKNSQYFGITDGGGTVRPVLSSTAGQVIVGNTVAPAAGGDVFLSSFTGTTEALIRLEARNDNVAVFQPQLTGDGASTDAYYVGDNNRPFTGIIALGHNAIGYGGSPAQFLIEEQGTTGGAGNFITILGGASQTADYTIGLPDDAPSVGEFLKVASLDGSVYNLEWASGGGGGGSGCVPTGSAGEGLFDDGAGGCTSIPEVSWDSTNTLLRVGGAVTPLATTQMLVADTTGAGARLTIHGTSAGVQVLRFDKTGVAQTWAFYRPGSSTEFRILGPAGDTMIWESGGGVSLPNTRPLQWRDSGGTSRHVLSSSNGQVILGHTAAPASGGDTFVTSYTGSTLTSLRFQARADNVFVLQPQFTSDGTSTNAYYLGDNSRYWTAYIGISANLLSRGGAPAQLLLEDENASNRFVTVLGAPGTMAASYAIRLPATAPTASQVLTASAFSGGAWNLAWSTGGGGGGFTCDTANNCVDISSTQTVNGQKTFNASFTFAKTTLPVSGSTYNLGSSSARWNTVYSERLTIYSALTGNGRADLLGSIGNDNAIFSLYNASGSLRSYSGNADSGTSGYWASISSTSQIVSIWAKSTAAATGVYVNNTQVVGPRQSAVSNCTDGTNTCTQLNALLSRLRAHGLISP